MDVDRNAELRDRAGWQWSTALRPRLEGPGRACGPAEDPFGDRPTATPVPHIHRELIHRGTKTALLRDNYRARHGLG